MGFIEGRYFNLQPFIKDSVKLSYLIENKVIIYKIRHVFKRRTKKAQKPRREPLSTGVDNSILSITLSITSAAPSVTPMLSTPPPRPAAHSSTPHQPMTALVNRLSTAFFYITYFKQKQNTLLSLLSTTPLYILNKHSLYCLLLPKTTIG